MGYLVTITRWTWKIVKLILLTFSPHSHIYTCELVLAVLTSIIVRFRYVIVAFIFPSRDHSLDLIDHERALHHHVLVAKLTLAAVTLVVHIVALITYLLSIIWRNVKRWPILIFCTLQSWKLTCFCLTGKRGAVALTFGGATICRNFIFQILFSQGCPIFFMLLQLVVKFFDQRVSVLLLLFKLLNLLDSLLKFYIHCVFLLFHDRTVLLEDWDIVRCLIILFGALDK